MYEVAAEEVCVKRSVTVELRINQLANIYANGEHHGG